MDNNKTIFKVLNIFAFVAMIAVNVAAEAMPLGGLTTKAISDLYPTLLTPAGITFSIWSLIYVFLAWYVMHQLLSTNDKATTRTTWLFAVSCALNIAWLFFWHTQIMLLATLSIIGLLACLIIISSRLRDMPWYISGAFSIYKAWITVATVAQIFVLLTLLVPEVLVRNVSVGITVAALILLCAAGIYNIVAKSDILYGITIAWALVGVFIKHIGKPYAGEYELIVLISGIGAVLTLSAILFINYIDKEDAIDNLRPNSNPSLL